MPTSPSHARLLAARAAHWERTRRMTLILLVLWLLTCFGTIFFARELSHLAVFGWPLSFYMAAQGASLVSLAVIAFYAWRMRVLDRRHLDLLGSNREDA
ncbi:MAG: sodium/substrate symporter small subunit [Pseudomonadota bacterium]